MSQSTVEHQRFSLKIKRKFLLENQTQLKDLPVVFLLALLDDENVVLSGKFFGRVKLCKHIKGSPNFTSIFPYPKMGKQGAPVVKTRNTCSIFASAFCKNSSRQPFIVVSSSLSDGGKLSKVITSTPFNSGCPGTNNCWKRSGNFFIFVPNPIVVGPSLS